MAFQASNKPKFKAVDAAKRYDDRLRVINEDLEEVRAETAKAVGACTRLLQDLLQHITNLTTLSVAITIPGNGLTLPDIPLGGLAGLASLIRRVVAMITTLQEIIENIKATIEDCENVAEMVTNREQLLSLVARSVRVPSIIINVPLPRPSGSTQPGEQNGQSGTQYGQINLTKTFADILPGLNGDVNNMFHYLIMDGSDPRSAKSISSLLGNVEPIRVLQNNPDLVRRIIPDEIESLSGAYRELIEILSNPYGLASKAGISSVFEGLDVPPEIPVPTGDLPTEDVPTVSRLAANIDNVSGKTEPTVKTPVS